MVHKVIKYEWCRGLMSIIHFPSSMYHLGRLNRNSKMEEGKDIKHFFFIPDEIRLREAALKKWLTFSGIIKYNSYRDYILT